MKLYGSHLRLVSRTESWMLKDCTNRARKITASKNKHRARQDSKREIEEQLDPIDSNVDLELKHESFAEFMQWHDYDLDEQDIFFQSCNSARCFACCKDLDGTQQWSCLEDNAQEWKAFQAAREKWAAKRLGEIAAIEEALATPIRDYTLQELLDKLPEWLEDRADA